MSPFLFAVLYESKYLISWLMIDRPYIFRGSRVLCVGALHCFARDLARNKRLSKRNEHSMYMRKPHGLDKHFSVHGCNAKLKFMSADEAFIGADRKVEVARNSKV
jgi:hypothetical protein